MEIDDIYTDATKRSSDIRNHIPLLKEYAEKCETVTEFGFREGVSTIAFLAAKPRRVISYDIVPCPISNHMRAAREANVVFTFIQESSIEVEIEPTDLLFIDSLHTFTQMATELTMHHHKVKKYIIAHDTKLFGRKGGGGDVSTCRFYREKGVMDAIEDFIKVHPHWKMTYNDMHDKQGLVVLTNTNNVEE